MAFCLALAKAGSKSAARMAMIAITTSNSMRVNALALRVGLVLVPGFDAGFELIARIAWVVVWLMLLREHYQQRDSNTRLLHAVFTRQAVVVRSKQEWSVRSKVE